MQASIRGRCLPGTAHVIAIADIFAPQSPATAEDTGLAPEILSDLILRFAFRYTTFTSERASKELHLPVPITTDLIQRLKKDKLVENLGAAGQFDYRYAITDAGHERARRLFEISGYVGPAPVSLDDYCTTLEIQLASLPDVSPEQVTDAIAELVLPPETVEVASLAGSSGRSLFIYGPPGNGKTTLGHLLHNAVSGDIWIPYCIAIEQSVIRIYDPRFHHAAPLDVPPDDMPKVDRRWIRIQRPFIVAAGELTIDALDLGYSAELGFYEAPLHVKANGGTFLLDDLGCQRVSPWDLLSRWVFPLENGTDLLTLQTGQKLQIPFRQRLIVSTNLNPDQSISPMFMRRMGYRVFLDDPSQQNYAEVFRRYAKSMGLSVPEALLGWIFDRYQTEARPMRGCEPRDLLERVRDICHFRHIPLQLNEKTLSLAWAGYFGGRQNGHT
jgi:predicted ATPase with chaperone activity